MTTREGPWLVAAWPGMGAVGVLAAAHLLRQLGVEPLGEIPPEAYFDLQEVAVEHGLLQTPRYPRTTLYRWRNPRGPDLVLMLAEAQPQARGFSLCQELIGRARALDVSRVVTFAAMATPNEPSAPSRVHVMATDPTLLEEARRLDAELLDEGAISGMNGVLLAAAQARELPGLCILGEFPYFASSIPQPKAAAAVLRCFSRLSGIPLDLSDLDEEAAVVEDQLTALLERLLREARAQGEEGAEPELGIEAALGGQVLQPEPEEPPAPQAGPLDRLDPAVLAQIEALFAEAERDRGRALELKALLDQHGVFKALEDRFLDLFKHGE